MGSDRAIALVGGTPWPGAGEGADSILVVGERIEAIGPRSAIREQAGGRAEIIELAERSIIPGFRDAHFHFYQAGLFLARPSLAGCTSRAEALDVIHDAVREHPGDSPIFVEEWDETGWVSPDPPTRIDLDAIDRKRAIVARRVCGHVAAVNRAGIDILARTSGPDGIDFETGLVREGPVPDLDEIFHPTPEGARRALRRATRRCLSLGITTACDFLRPRSAAVYRDLVDGDDPGIDLDIYVLEACLDEAGLFESLPEGRGFRRRGVKIFTDGSIGGRTAALGEDYAGQPGERGTLLLDDDTLRASMRRAADRGLALAVHAIGDRAIDQVLRAYGSLPRELVIGRDHRIEHLEVPAPGDLDRLRDLGVRPCMQPNFVGRWGGPGGLYETALGAGRASRMNPIASALRAETGVFFGSDGMPASPLFGIRSAVHHPVESERITPDEALELYTAAAAEALPTEKGAGRLAVGAPADLVVLPSPLAECVARSPGDGPDEVDITVRRGQIVHRRDAP